MYKYLMITDGRYGCPHQTPQVATAIPLRQHHLASGRGIAAACAEMGAQPRINAALIRTETFTLLTPSQSK